MLHSGHDGEGAIENKFNALPKVPKPPAGREWTYFLRAHCEPSLIKIGHSVSLKWRLSGLQTQCPVQLSLVGLTQAPAGTELLFHEALASSRSHGEWFRPTEQVEQIRRQLPRGGAIETMQLVTLLAPFGIGFNRITEVTIWAANTAKHSCKDDDDAPLRLRYGYTTEQMRRNSFRELLRELNR
jgi:hypothetical protein